MTKKLFVLSGGGCRGFAHLGVIKALQENNIYPLEISGTSAGAIAGTFLANGFMPDEILEMFTGKLKFSILAWNGFEMGLISMKNIREFLEKNLRYKNFEELQIPLHVTATNFLDGRQTIFTRGNLIDAIIAASSVPVLFPPTFIDSIPYIDGGLSNNLPVEPFIDRKDEVISIYVNPIKIFDLKETIPAVLDRALHLSFREMVSRSATGCFLYIEPQELNAFGLFDIHKIGEIFETGYTSAKKLLLDAPIF